jgi:hypothetical protein
MEGEPAGDQLSVAHRQSGWMLIFTLSLILFLLYATTAAIAGVGSILLVLTLMSTPLCILIVRGYFRRDAWALPYVMLIWIVAIGICFLLALVNAAISGDTWAMVQAGLLIFLCWSMSQRLRLLRHPMFRAWYDGISPALSTELALELGEVLASCPHCQSLLAIRPLQMTPKDECPHCTQRLVLTSTVAKFLEEE